MKISPLSRLLTGFLSWNKHNANADKIEAAFQNTLSRDGSDPNAMASNLDMGSNRLINVGAPLALTDAARLQDVVGDAVINISGSYDDLTDKPTTFPPTAHTHPESDVTNLVSDLAGKSAVGHTHTSGEVTDFHGAVDAIVGADLVAGSGMTVTYNAGTGKTTLVSSATGSTAYGSLTGVPTTFTPAAHSHPESDITSLTTDLAGKAPVSHTHSSSDITNFGSSVGSALSPGAGISLSTSSGVTTITATGGATGLPFDYWPAFENGIKTSNVASTNTTNLNNLITSLHSLGGGTIWFNEPGAIFINGQITLRSNVSFKGMRGGGSQFSWAGGSSGNIFASSPTEVLIGCDIEIVVDEGASFNSGVVFNLHSAEHNRFYIRGMGANTASVFALIVSDSTAGEFAGGGRNTAFNTFELFHRGQCGCFCLVDGSADTVHGFNGQQQAVTLNTFYNCQANFVHQIGFRFESWCDSNTLSGNTYAGVGGFGGIGFIVNQANSGLATVYNLNIQHLAIDTFSTGLSRYGMVLNNSKAIMCDSFYQDPPAENGSFIGTNCLSYQIRGEQTSSNNIFIHQKGISTGL